MVAYLAYFHAFYSIDFPDKTSVWLHYAYITAFMTSRHDDYDAARCCTIQSYTIEAGFCVFAGFFTAFGA